MLKLIGIFSVVSFSELMQRIFKYDDIQNISLTPHFDVLNDFLCHYIQESYTHTFKNGLVFRPLCTYIHTGRGGLVVGRPTAVREDPGSNLTAAGRVYHDSHCDIQPWARVVHPYCSA